MIQTTLAPNANWPHYSVPGVPLTPWQKRMVKTGYVPVAKPVKVIKKPKPNRLNPQQAQRVRELAEKGVRKKELARLYECSLSTIYLAINMEEGYAPKDTT